MAWRFNHWPILALVQTLFFDFQPPKLIIPAKPGIQVLGADAVRDCFAGPSFRDLRRLSVLARFAVGESTPVIGVGILRIEFQQFVKLVYGGRLPAKSYRFREIPWPDFNFSRGHQHSR